MSDTPVVMEEDEIDRHPEDRGWVIVCKIEGAPDRFVHHEFPEGHWTIGLVETMSMHHTFHYDDWRPGSRDYAYNEAKQYLDSLLKGTIDMTQNSIMRGVSPAFRLMVQAVYTESLEMRITFNQKATFELWDMLRPCFTAPYEAVEKQVIAIDHVFPRTV